MKYKRKPTEAQCLAAKARREALTTLAKEAAKMTPEELRGFFPNPVTTIEGTTLSPKNTYLILRQNPQATLVGGFNQWKKVKRHVIKGAKSLGIFVPKNQSTEEPKAEESGTPAERTFFVFGSVFDISQTEENQQPTNN